MYRREEEVEPCGECVACRPLTLDDAWEVLGEMLRDDYREYRREANEARSSRVVLQTAREALTASGHHMEADAISAMLDQRGCEGFDPAVTDGRLTTLMDVIIHG
jgi:hypothetical protein